jgi:hypothetical protein
MRLYLDDLRVTPWSFDIRTYTYADTIAQLETGRITHISLDHDLNCEGELEILHTGTGYDVACWIEENAHNGTLPRLTWEVHSMNPTGAQRIRQAMLSADRYWTLHEEEDATPGPM